MKGTSKENEQEFDDNLCAHNRIECCGTRNDSGSPGESEVWIEEIKIIEGLLVMGDELCSIVIQQDHFEGHWQEYSTRIAFRRAIPELKRQDIQLHCIFSRL